MSWENGTDTPVPAEGPWLALGAEQGHTTVSDVKVELDPDFQKMVANGYTNPDPLMTVRAVSLMVTLHTMVSGREHISQTAVSVLVQVGSSQHHVGYGAATTNRYVARAVS